jgi:hypothetical protein
MFFKEKVCVVSDPGTHLTDCEEIAIIADAIKRRNERDQQF